MFEERTHEGQAEDDLAAVLSPLGSPHCSIAGVAGFRGGGGKKRGHIWSNDAGGLLNHSDLVPIATPPFTS